MHGFGLDEVEPAGEEGALRKLTRGGQARALGQRGGNNGGEHDRGAVGRNLDQVLARIGVRRVEGNHHGVIDGCRRSPGATVFRRRSIPCRRCGVHPLRGVQDPGKARASRFQRPGKT